MIFFKDDRSGKRAAITSALLVGFIFIVSGLVFGGSALALSAKDLTTRIRLDFSPVRAEVVRVGKEGVTISIPKGAVVSAGDIFSVYSRSSAGQGSFETSPARLSGKLQVVTVSDRSARCRIIERDAAISKGDIAIRFEGLRAVLYLDENAVAPRFSTGSLRLLLPYLDWLEPHEAIMPVMEPKSMKALKIDLLFRFKDGDLLIYGPDLKPFKVYKEAASLLPEQEEGQAGSSTAALNSESDGAATSVPAPFLSLSAAEEIGRLEARPVKIAIEDLDGDGRQEIVYLLNDAIYVSPFRAEGSVSRFAISGFERPYSFSVLPGKGLIALNVLLDGAGLRSALLKYEAGSGLRLIQGDMNLWLAFVDTDCDGRAETLLGQSFNRERFRSDDIYKIVPLANGVEYAGTAEYPPGFNVNGNVQAIFSATGGCSLVLLSVQGFMKVYGATGVLEWSSLVPVVKQFEGFGTPDVFMTPISRQGRQMVLYRGHPAGKDPDRCWLCALASTGDDSFTTFYALSPADSKEARVCGIQMLNDRLVIAIVRNESEDEDEPRYVTRLYSFDLAGGLPQGTGPEAD